MNPARSDGGRLPGRRTPPPAVPSRAARRRCVALVLLAAAGLAGACRPDAAPPASPGPEIPPEADFLREIDRTRGHRDDFRALVDPAFVAPADAPLMDDAEMVLALDLGSAQVCYPTRHLDRHEIVEHSLAGLELMACW